MSPRHGMPRHGRMTRAWAVAALTALAAAPASGTAGAAEAAASGDPTPVESTVLAAPPLPGGATPTDVALTDSVIFVEGTANGVERVYWRSRTAAESDPWQAAWAGEDLTGGLLAAEDDVVHLDSGADERLIWTAAHDGSGGVPGSRIVRSGTVLGHGTRYVSSPLLNVPLTDRSAQLTAVTSPLVINTYLVTAGHQPTGTQLHAAMPYLSGATVQGFSDGTKVSPTSETYHCAPGSSARLADARGRVSLVFCSDGTLGVLDHRHVLRPYQLASGVTNKDVVLGSGFVVAGQATTGELLVIPLRGDTRGSLGRGTKVDVDDAATALAFIDDTGGIRIADLRAWSASLPEPIPDTYAPRVTSLTIGKSNDGMSNVSVEAVDYSESEPLPETYPSGIASIAVQRGTMSNGTIIWQSAGTIRDSMGGINVLMPAMETNVCWRARATDKGGNVGDWRSACSTLGRIERIAGSNPYETAVKVSQRAFAPGRKYVYVVGSGNAHDALAGSAAAGFRKSPVLLVGKNWVPSAVSAEIRRLAPDKIVLLGNTDVVSTTVSDRLAQLAPVWRIGGSNRYETAARLSRATYGDLLKDNPLASVYFVNPDRGVQALAAAARQPNYGQPAPLLLTRHAYVPSTGLAEARRLDPENGCVVGAVDDVSEHAFTQVSEATSGACRFGDHDDVGGTSDYAIAANLSIYAISGRKEEIYVATGESLPDAFPGAAAARTSLVPLVLVKKGYIPASSQRILERANVGTIRVVGDTDAISSSVLQDLTKYLD